MTLINDRAHEVVDRACENLTRWPNEFIGQEDLVMLIHEAIEAAVEEEREACAKIAHEYHRLVNSTTYESVYLTTAANDIQQKIRARSESNCQSKASR